MASRLAVVIAVAALCLSVWALKEATQIGGDVDAVAGKQDIRQMRAETEGVCCIESLAHRGNGTDVAPSHDPLVRTAPAQLQQDSETFEPLGDQTDSRSVTYRGDERVIDIGEIVEVDETYFDASSGEPVDLGARIDP